ncbi:hypothetical protein SLS56_012166 [Neofusicoccum ribis]|uniref:FAD-binding PCMH-type domain-containing protein n=1 Tax=Neofusicoccum ribis TaxID=45134 RepID=A0ABR3S9L6_9PEZI
MMCGSLEAAGLKIDYPADTTYEDSIDSYYSELARLHPWCIVQPVDAQEVSKIVTTLVAASDGHGVQCRFAVRSGGHTTWAGAANIEQGVTVDLGAMNSTIYHAENSTAAIEVGARWWTVYETLDEIGISSPGGRSPMPGAGGLTIGGGISFFNARVGFVCDSVANFEPQIVLASGEIVNANKEENADLWQALKGGSNNFGIVTRIDMMTFENGGDLWGGFVYYDNSTAEQHVKAFTHFVDKIESDPNASNILFTATSPVSSAGEIIFLTSPVYTKPVERPPIYDELLAIPGNLTNFTTTVGIRNMSTLVGTVQPASGFRQIFRTCTFQNDEHVLMKALELSADWTERFKHESIEGDWVSATQFHPIPKIFSERSVERGGNVLGLERFSSNLVVFLAVFTWEDATKDSLFHSAAEQLIEDVVEFSRSLGKDNEWIYLNYADKDQNPLESYGPENVAKIRAAAVKYDPDGVFQTLVPGGFKISEIKE